MCRDCQLSMNCTCTCIYYFKPSGVRIRDTLYIYCITCVSPDRTPSYNLLHTSFMWTRDKAQEESSRLSPPELGDVKASLETGWLNLFSSPLYSLCLLPPLTPSIYMFIPSFSPPSLTLTDYLSPPLPLSPTLLSIYLSFLLSPPLSLLQTLSYLPSPSPSHSCRLYISLPLPLPFCLSIYLSFPPFPSFSLSLSQTMG